MLDLRTGACFREEECGNGPPMRSLRFASLHCRAWSRCAPRLRSAGCGWLAVPAAA